MRVISALLILALLALSCPSSPAQAALLTSASLRLDRSKTSSPISALVCVTPSSAGAGTEGHVSITFPSSFSISTTASNWTTSTVSLPSGSTAWPGIGTQATTVSGKTVTLTSSDLTSNVARYCFTLTSSNSNNGTTTGSVSGTITTKTSGGVQIDTKGYSVSISNNDQVTVSGTIPANPTDFEASLTKTDPTRDTIYHESAITYQLAYGSLLDYPTNITVQAEWELGTLSGSSTPTVELLEYVVSSASNAYGNTQPVIDTVNRTISWEIPSFPGNTQNQTVTFQLRTRNVETSTSPITFSVNGRVIGPGTQTPDSTVSLEYLHGSQVAQPTSAVTATPTPITTSTPVPTTTPLLYRFLNIEMYEIATSSASVFVETSKPSEFVIMYGQTPRELTQQIRTSGYSSSQRITLQNLSLDMPYYFQIEAISGSERITSDIYTFRTPESARQIEFDPDSLIVSSNQVIIFNNNYKSQKGRENFFTLPKGSHFTFQLAQVGSEQAERIQAYLESENVLGVQANASNDHPASSIQLIEVRKGVYLARMSTPLVAGVYTLKLRVFGQSGSLTVKDVARIRLLDPLLVHDAATNEPIEGARIRLSLFNISTRLFQEVVAFFKLEEYPLATNSQGTSDIVLPPGKYRAEVKALGYNTAVIDFTIGPDSGENYPTILLTKSGFNVGNAVSYYADSFFGVTSSLEEYLSTLFQSRRFYQVVNALCIIILVTLSILSLSHHIGLPIIYLPLLLKHHGKGLLIRRKGDQTISGEIIDHHSGSPLSGVHVFLLDGLRKVALDNTLTNKSGTFSFEKLSPFPMTIRCEKQGYISFSHAVSPSLQPNLKFALVKDTIASEAGAILKHTIGLALERFSEFLLIGSIIVEIAFGYSFGWLEALPFLIISCLNFLYYIYYNRVINS